MSYSCCDKHRRGLLERQHSLNGIDFVVVSGKHELKVHFVNKLHHELSPESIRIEGGARVRNIKVIGVSKDPEGAPNVLIVRLSEPGDFASYTLRLIDPAHPKSAPSGYDPAFAAADFSFKFKTRSEFDPRRQLVAPETPFAEPIIDYLAKDYSSFRRLLLNRLATVSPDWKEPHLPDVGVALVELLAYVGDYLSYQQDAVATEAYLGTARRRVSVRRHARLIDYHMHDGCNARAWVQVQVQGHPGREVKLSRGENQFLTGIDGEAVQGDIENPVIEYSSAEYEKALTRGVVIFEPMHDVSLYPEHNEMRFYTWSDTRCCLPRGATRATLEGHFPKLGAGQVLIFEESCDPYSGEAGDSDVRMCHVVRLTHVGLAIDALDGGTKITEITWAEADALSSPLCISARADAEHNERDINNVTVARGNIVLVDHGQTVPPFQPTLSPSELKDAKSLAAKLKEPKGPVSVFIRDRLSDETSQALDQWAGAAPIPSLLLEALVNDLNAVIMGPPIWDKDRFSHVTVRPKVLDLLTGNPHGAQVMRANRILLEDAYPEELPRQGELLSAGNRTQVPDITMFHAQAMGGDRCNEPRQSPVMPRFRPTLSRKPLTQAVPYDEQSKRAPATEVMNCDPRDAKPQIWLQSLWQSRRGDWEPKHDLLNSDSDEMEFVAETELDGTTSLRFGEGQHGLRPAPGTSFTAIYRVGNGKSGNVGPEAIAYLATRDYASMKAAVADKDHRTGGNAVRNPLPAKGGVEMERIEDVRNTAPEAVFNKPERAVTEADYVQLVQSAFGMKIQKSVATYRWTGSWHTVFLAVDRRGGLPLDDDFKKSIVDFLEPHRMAGYDLEVVEPCYVPLEIKLQISVKPDCFCEQVKQELLEEFSNRVLRGGRRGFFHPDEWTFGQPVYLSKLCARAQSVPGVVSVHLSKCQRRDRPDESGPEPEAVKMGRLEIARLDNNPSFPEFGLLTLEMRGGR
jgi:hypothetical protein